jgi:hypothetical protein
MTRFRSVDENEVFWPRTDGCTENVRGDEASHHRRISGRPVPGEPGCAPEGASSGPCCSARRGGVHQVWNPCVPPEREAHCRLQSRRTPLFLSPDERRNGRSARGRSRRIRYEPGNHSVPGSCRLAGDSRSQAGENENCGKNESLIVAPLFSAGRWSRCGDVPARSPSTLIGRSQSTIDTSSSPSRAGLPMTSISVILPFAIVNRSALASFPRGATTTPMAPSTSAGRVSWARCP